MDWRDLFESELTKASQARSRRNEGQARVCARRAAGIVARQYLERSGAWAGKASALDVLQELRLHPAVPPAARLLIDRLTQRVDAAFRLPADVDLIRDARELRAVLLRD